MTAPETLQMTYHTQYTQRHILREWKQDSKACTPTPMMVGEPTTPLGNDIDYSKDTWLVNDGVCGFAWINIKPEEVGL